jgi:hypothetical protein
MAERGEDTLRFGPMKPIGLVDPRTGRRPYAVIQLRPEDAAATAYNLVGFQTRMKYPEQLRVFRMIPGSKRRSSCGSARCTATRSSTRRRCSTTMQLARAGRVPRGADQRGRGLRGERGGRVPLRADARAAPARGKGPRAASGHDGARRAPHAPQSRARPRTSLRTSPGPTRAARGDGRKRLKKRDRYERWARAGSPTSHELLVRAGRAL